MAVQILHELKLSKVEVYSRIFCSGFLHDQRESFCKDTIDSFNEHCFINEFCYTANRWKTWKLRRLINEVGEQFKTFSPNLVIVFTDNSYIYQDALKSWKKRIKIVLFHEGYGDYSDPTSTLRESLPYRYIQMMVWPHTYYPVTRSYTGLYDYSFLLQPDLVNRDFPFEKNQIPTDFIKSIYYKEPVLEAEISAGSILLTFSGKDWVNDKKLKEYLISCVRKLNTVNRNIYMKIAPNVNPAEYQFLTEHLGVMIIDQPSFTSESFCYHPNFDYVVTDESSAVINAIYGGVKKTFFFLNAEIQQQGIYRYDKNDLVKYLQQRELICQVGVDAMVTMIASKHLNSHFIESTSAKSVGDVLKGVLYD